MCLLPTAVLAGSVLQPLLARGDKSCLSMLCKFSEVPTLSLLSGHCHYWNVYS